MPHFTEVLIHPCRQPPNAPFGVLAWLPAPAAVCSSNHAYPVPLHPQLVNWGVEMMTQGAFTLREAERSAKGQKLRIWQNYTPPASAGQSTASHAVSVTSLRSAARGGAKIWHWPLNRVSAKLSRSEW